ncbi:CRISPR system precrRNA processing endoribonuclease RAMP protein Cas6 [Fusobacterium nucleatum]|uniref:CRISPR system precrRNA processing endoribonuclease RAMP protein Cas6 n=1 Tax=Fusobacterium nucleatum TaxID=851 RepID=UPI001F51942C|nr:CRISPR system precrRNA processing endoribonuclease RAMP protein Cas6 [Fusobacterium nucleatum]
MKRMLAQINMELEANGLNSNMGSLFHGYLMENIDSAYAEYFHYNTTNPFTSCIFKEVKTNKFFWRITTFNQKAYDMIMTCFSNNIPESIYLKNKDLEINVKSFSIQKKSYEDLFLECTERKRIRLITPTSFKSNGVTHIFPNISTLISGVIAKINQHLETAELGDKKIIDELLEKIYIKDYNLRTKVFYLENIKIKGFIGTMDLAIKGEDSTLANILNFLILMSEYTGFGIKTSLGMGGVKIE